MLKNILIGLLLANAVVSWLWIRALVKEARTAYAENLALKSEFGKLKFGLIMNGVIKLKPRDPETP